MRHAMRAAPALPAALFVGWTSSTFPFFPEHSPLVLAAFFYVIWNMGFTEDDRTLFRRRKVSTA